MSKERVERRLAAVLAADVAGYSRLMGADEEETLVRLKAGRKAIVDPTIASHRGHMVKTTGDGMLIEFASTVDAVRGAVEIQECGRQNAGVPPDQRIEFRIGIHVGDVIFDDNDIFGDAVNIAARLESMPNRAGSACLTMPIGRSGAKSRLPVMIWDSSHSKILLSLCGRGGFGRLVKPLRSKIRFGCEPASGAPASRQALHRSAVVPEHERRSRAGIFR